jgi:hypothetical protein
MKARAMSQASLAPAEAAHFKTTHFLYSLNEIQFAALFFIASPLIGNNPNMLREIIN